MNMKTNFQSLATRLITGVFGAVAQTVTIRHPVYSSYDEQSGSIISAHEDFTITGIVGPWTEDNSAARTSESVRADDSALLVSYVQLELMPELNVDIAITEDGTEWNIVDSVTDPSEAAVKFRLSKVIES